MLHPLKTWRFVGRTELNRAQLEARFHRSTRTRSPEGRAFGLEGARWWKDDALEVDHFEVQFDHPILATQVWLRGEVRERSSGAEVSLEVPSPWSAVKLLPFVGLGLALVAARQLTDGLISWGLVAGIGLVLPVWTLGRSVFARRLVLSAAYQLFPGQWTPGARLPS